MLQAGCPFAGVSECPARPTVVAHHRRAARGWQPHRRRRPLRSTRRGSLAVGDGQPWTRAACNVPGGAHEARLAHVPQASEARSGDAESSARRCCAPLPRARRTSPLSAHCLASFKDGEASRPNLICSPSHPRLDTRWIPSRSLEEGRGQEVSTGRFTGSKLDIKRGKLDVKKVAPGMA